MKNAQKSLQVMMNKMAMTQKATKPKKVKTFSQLFPKELPATQLHHAIDSHNNAPKEIDRIRYGVIVPLFLEKLESSLML